MLSTISDTITKLNPGKNASHHLPLFKYFIDSDNIIPIAGSCGGNPNPRNVIDASCKIACGNTNTIPTKS